MSAQGACQYGSYGTKLTAGRRIALVELANPITTASARSGERARVCLIAAFEPAGMQWDGFSRRLEVQSARLDALGVNRLR